MLGDVLAEQEGEPFFQLVEQTRTAAIARRQGDAGAEERLAEALMGLPPERAALLTRAFSAYFQLVNLAERVHRIRRRREYQRSSTTPQPGSLRQVVAALAADGVTLEHLVQLVGQTRSEPVFTAHPTEATRRTLLVKHQRIARALVDRLDPSRTPAEERAALGRIRAEITTGWQTQELLTSKPQVSDEVEHVLFYLADVIYRVMPAFYEELEDALVATYGERAREVELPLAVGFASWVGGDMDGNPNVGPDTIATTLTRQRALIVARYVPEVRALAGELSQSMMRVGVDGAIIRRSMQYSGEFRETADSIPPRYRDMPYRVLLTLMARRLDATVVGDPRGYRSASGFVDDLRLIERSLGQHKGHHAGRFRLRRTIRRAQTFGFHLVTLDVRQDALVHREVVGRLLGNDVAEWLAHTPSRRAAVLTKALADHAKPVGEPDAVARDTLAVFEAIREGRKRYGTGAIGPYIISMAQSTEDVLAVLLLARWGGLADAEGRVALDIAPLFETVPDLRRAQDTMNALMAHAIYREHVARRGDRQVIMIGYSDSSKEGGLCASRWSIQRAQTELLAAMDAHGIATTFFHGKGGTVSRGGGKTHRAILAEPRGSVRGGLRFTEQGEVINAKYGLRGIALRNLELTVGAAIGATAGAAKADAAHDKALSEWSGVMERLGRESRGAYRALVYDDPDFTAYFRAATPIDVIERLKIGSRPASRRKGGGVENLRAIPWVFAWTQSRHLLPGWYGLGTGLETVAGDVGAKVLIDMTARWPFFATLVSDVERVLAKADMGVAERYAELAGAVGERIFPRIVEEFERTKRWVLKLRAADTLLAGDTVTQRSIALRNPYVDPMSMLQLDLLKRWRATSREDEGLEHALLITLNGIAHGLRATG